MKRRPKILLAVISILILLLGVVLYIANDVQSWLQVEPISVGSDASEADRIAAVDHWLTEQFEQHKFNGGVLLVRDGQVLLSKTCGFTDHTATQRLDDHTAFRLASVSKQFTAAGILRLAQMGSISLDDSVAMHLEGFISDQVTIRHLLNQTSGIPDIYEEVAEQRRDEFGRVLTISNVVELVKEHGELEREPGDAMEYSNTNYVLLAGIIESVSGESFERFMQDELFKPLGMNDTRVWNLLSTDRSPNQSYGFDQIDGDRTPVRTTWIDGVSGDGAVFCSLHDLVIWDRFWDGNPLVSDDLLEQAFERPKLNDGTSSDYGFGWVVEGKRHWHNGAWLAANTYIVRYPESHCCLVVLDNSSNEIWFDEIARHLEETLNPLLLERTSIVKLRDAKLAPFTGVRWEDELPLVRVQGSWSRLDSINGIPIDRIIEFSEKQYGEKAHKRFTEDLVEVLSAMGQEPKPEVTLGLESASGQVEQLQVQMTEQNRDLARKFGKLSQPR